MYRNKLYAIQTNFLVDYEKWKNEEIFAKIRYSSKIAKAKVNLLNNMIEVIFEEPQRAITKGQSVVFYDKDKILLRRRKDNLKLRTRKDK